MACDFNPTWPAAPHYNGNFLTFLLEVIEWVALVFGSAIFDLVGGLAVGLACLVYAALVAPVYFLLAIFTQSVPTYLQFGPWGPVVGALVFAAVIIILLGLFIGLYRIIPENIEATTEEIEGKQPPSTESSSEVGEALSEV